MMIPATAASTLTAATPTITQAPAPSPPAISKANVAAPEQPKISKASTEANVQEVKKAVQALNKKLEQVPTSVRFQIDHDSGNTVITVMDTEKNSVIRQYPSEEVLAISRAMSVKQGMIINTKT